MIPPPPNRRGWPTVIVATDLVRHALANRSWLPLLVVIAAVIAAIVVLVGQAALPYAIYPAL